MLATICHTPSSSSILVTDLHIWLTSLWYSPCCRTPFSAISQPVEDMKRRLCLAQDVAVLEPKVHTLAQKELREQSARAM